MTSEIATHSRGPAAWGLLFGALVFGSTFRGVDDFREFAQAKAYGSGRAVEHAAIEPRTAAPEATSPSDPDRVRLVSAMGLMLVVGLLLVGVFLLGTYIFVRASRRARSALFRQRPPPTKVDDVWSTHKVPGDANGDGLKSEDSAP